MNILKKEKLLEINGGINWTGTFISSISRAINTIADLGRALGTSIRRIGSGSMCSY